jgi:hypothetical protein
MAALHGEQAQEEQDKKADAKFIDLNETGASVHVEQMHVNIPVTTNASKEDIEDAVHKGISKAVAKPINILPWAPGMPIPSAQ